ncbi:MANSC domain-containing protein 1 [Poeciliopsis prolifica]|uniref:MANSC domain-containing protein 1 n=1 Tax=Poeciliopsis prolifica TaxID=188132 RepID=UPI002413F779|nr:MANSC domain-containing protein 1 [Poeciliopsis prolifica]XP_054876719.1 MANSC domain-containing protein 1 [Poeciliopsis prolifica]
MTPQADLRPLPWLLIVMLLMSFPAAALEPEMCFYRQHQGAAVNVRAALSRDAAAMMAQSKLSEQDCVKACCSTEVGTGARCNTAMFKANKHPGEGNCLLFHCPTESDCPLMKTTEGSNTSDIYKGLSHPPTLRPLPMTTTLHPTSTSTSITSAPTTPATSTIGTPTTAQALHSTPEPSPPIIIIATEPAGTPPTNTTTTTTMGSSPTRKPNKTSKKQNKTTKKGKSHPILTTTTQTAPSSMTSLPGETGRKEVEDKHSSVLETTTSATTTTVAPTTSTTSTTPTTTATFSTAQRTSTSAQRTSTSAQRTSTSAQRTSTTAQRTSTSAQRTSTSAQRTSTTAQRTSTTEPTATVTAQSPSLIFIPKDPVQTEPDLQPGHPTLNSSSSRGKVVAAQGALKGGVLAFMVLALAVLTLALAVGGRKAMESFDRRHYTRLELNDLHYEI